MKDLTWGTAWNYTRAEMRDPSSADSKTYDQNIVGTALSWTPDNWTFSFGGGWYQNFLTTKKTDVHNYFAGDAWGLNILRAINSRSINTLLNLFSRTLWATACST
jgi:predicted porin